jgi:hypothetical protein
VIQIGESRKVSEDFICQSSGHFHSEDQPEGITRVRVRNLRGKLLIKFPFFTHAMARRNLREGSSTHSINGT